MVFNFLFDFFHVSFFTCVPCTFKKRLDRFWDNQELKFNWKADIKGTASRSNLV